MEFIDCRKCSKSFNGLACLKMHMKSHENYKRNVGCRPKIRGHNKGKSKYRLKCPDCSNLFLQLDSLLVHRVETHSQHGTKGSANSGTDSLSVPSNRVTVEILSFPHTVIPNILGKAKAFNMFSKIQVIDYIHICTVDTCRRPFHFSKDLETHSKLHGEFKCHFCKVVKEYAPELSEHELVHLDKGIESEMPAKNSFWNCSRCKLNFPTKEKYFNHHLSSHLDLCLVLRNKCGICGLSGKCSRSNAELVKHYKYVHGISDSSANSVSKGNMNDCGACFSSRRALTSHLKSQLAYQGAMVNNRLKCEDCSKTYKDIQCLRNHRRLAHLAKADNLFRCTVPKCIIVCETEQDLQSHIQWKHSSAKMDFVDCPQCDKALNGTGSLKRHMKVHDREQKIKAGLIPKPRPIYIPHVCEICGKCFPAKRYLEQHSLSHSGPENWKFSCDVCSKKCMTKQNLNVHMRTHSQEKPFVCQICGQKYAHRFNLRIHVNSKHGDVAEDKPRKMDKTNFSSRKGIKRKRKEGSLESESSS